MTTTTPPRPSPRTGPHPAAQQLSPMHIIVQMVVDSARHSAVAARVWAAVFAVGCAIFGPLEWRYDMQPTLVWLQSHGVALQTTMVAAYGQAIGSSLLLIMPLIVKSITARWAHQFAFVGGLFVFAELFDLVTNWDAAWSLFGSLAPTWAAAPPAFGDILQWLLYWVLFGLVLIITTSVIQVIFIACAFCLVVSLWNSFTSRLVRWGAMVALAVVVLVVINR